MRLAPDQMPASPFINAIHSRCPYSSMALALECWLQILPRQVLHGARYGVHQKLFPLSFHPRHCRCRDLVAIIHSCARQEHRGNRWRSVHFMFCLHYHPGMLLEHYEIWKYCQSTSKACLSTTVTQSVEMHLVQSCMKGYVARLQYLWSLFFQGQDCA